MVNIEYINSPNEDHCEGVIWVPKTNEVVWVNVFEKPKIIIYNLITHEVSSIPVSGSITSIAPMRDNNFIATIEAILDVGAKPIIVNVDDNLHMDFEEVRKKGNKGNTTRKI